MSQKTDTIGKKNYDKTEVVMKNMDKEPKRTSECKDSSAKEFEEEISNKEEGTSNTYHSTNLETIVRNGDEVEKGQGKNENTS